MQEQAKYEALWAHSAYRAVAPGEATALHFLREVQPEKGASLYDFGCGTGRGAQRLKVLGDLKVTGIDFAANARDPECDFEFVQHDLTQPLTLPVADYGYCTDVMEHIPPEDVDRVIVNVTRAARRVFFQISLEDDVMGALVGEPLHLSVHPHDWWKETFERLHCTVNWSRDYGTHTIFYVTAYASGQDIKDASTVNTADEEIAAHIRANLSLGLTECAPHETQEDAELVILAGGPSLNDYVDEIRAHKLPIVTVNGAYNWALEHGFTPGAQIVLDARAFNARFVQPVTPNCKYLLASQCHPELVAALPRDQTFLWHSGTEAVLPVLEEIAKTATQDSRHFPVWGGMTVMLRALPLLRMLGFKKFHIYGWDSCLRDDTHHAYRQPENDLKGITTVTVGGRAFRCHGWMLTQAFEFQEMQPLLKDVQMAVYGDGLIAHIIKTAAERGSET